MTRLLDFLRDEDGSHTVEFVIWVPLFVFFLAATIDASVLYLTHTEMWNVARDAARRMSTRQFNEEEAARHARDELLMGGRQYYINASMQDEEATVVIRTYIWDASVFGIFGIFASAGSSAELRTLDAVVTMRMEPPIAGTNP